MNGTATATQKIDDAIKSLRGTLDKEVRLKLGQQRRNSMYKTKINMF